MDHLHKHAYSYTSHIRCFSFFLFLCRVYVCGLIRMKVACACQKDGESLQCIVFTGSLVLTQQAQQQSQSQATQQRHDYVEYHGFGVSYSILRLSLTLSDDLRLNQKLNLQCKQPNSKIKSSFLFGEKQTLHFEARCWQACYQSCPFFFNLHQDNNKKKKKKSRLLRPRRTMSEEQQRDLRVILSNIKVKFEKMNMMRKITRHTLCVCRSVVCIYRQGHV